MAKNELRLSLLWNRDDKGLKTCLQEQTGFLLDKENHTPGLWSGKLSVLYQKKLPPGVTKDFGLSIKINNQEGSFMSDLNSLAHTKCNCMYHIVFAPKYRRQIIYGKLKNDIGQILRQICERKGIEIIEAAACKDPIHM